MKRIFVFILALLTVYACKKEEVDGRLEPVDFSKPAVVGGNFMSGYQDGALTDRGQENSIPALIFDVVSVYGGGQFNVPLINSDEGIGLNPKSWVSVYQQKSVLGDRTDCNDVTSLGPVKELYETNNLTQLMNSSINATGQYQAVPYMTTSNMMDPAFGSDQQNNLFYHRWASDPGNSTVYNDLKEYAPTFSIVHLGMEDIFNYAINGGYGQTIPDPATFDSRLDSVLSAVTQNGGKGVIANIPSIDYFPFFNLIPNNGLTLRLAQADSLTELCSTNGYGHMVFYEGDNFFVTSDSNYPGGVRQMKKEEKLLLTAPLDSMKCFKYGTVGTFVHDRYVLDSTELTLIKNNISSYNQIIQQKAEEYDLAFFDMDGYFANVESGVKWDGADYDLEFVSGGFLSLDGLHPHEKGYVLLANGFIKSINEKYSTAIPNVNCLDCNGVLFP